MAHTLAAVFDDRKDAEGARDQLINAGFDRSCIRLNDTNSRYADASDMGNADSSLDTSATSATTTTTRSPDEDRSFMDSVRDFFSGLFGEEDDRHVYAEAVSRGHVVLTVQSNTQEEIERAADLVEACGPIDIDERQGQWTTGGWTGAAAASTAMSRQASASMQSGSGSLQGSPGGASQQRMQSAGSVQGSAADAARAFTEVDEDQGLGMRSLDRGGVRLFQRGDTRLGDDLPSRAQVGSQTYSEPDDEQFRSHWQSNYASSGRSYDEYAPAYQYGYTMAGNNTYRGRQWDDAETSLRSDWERQHPGSAWENFKAAVRHGWERMTS
ncbi:hypothetical protein [Pseudoduganella sp. GCM10020061]|uniref:hypothetical protein n=1 Tax=Pseudoduganella sp. GCM10020061 TaxID=3317345 RepID=UPI00363FEB03